MDYEPYDSSGTDDDLPPTHQNRMPRGGRVAGNGRPMAGGTYPRMYSEAEMEVQIHHLEQEAYSSVLRAFKAQADAITWEKESLITELRKELRLSNEEHRELLGRVNSDETIRRIREWRQAGVAPSNIVGMGQGVHDPSPSPTVSASRKKQKVGSSLPSFHQQPLSAPHHPSSSNAKHGPSSKGKKQKHMGLPMKSAPYPSVRGQAGGRMSANMAIEGATLVGKRVRTRWPDDNNFYEAVVTDYNPAEGRHALVYDIGTPNETWEWVSLSEISPEDIQWVDDTAVPHRGGYANPGQGMNRSAGRGNAYGTGRGRGVGKSQSRKEMLPIENGVGKKTADEIHILHTDSLIKEVERVFGSNHADPLEVEKAKKVLKDQEQALIDAIARLADISDGESDGGHHYGQGMERG